MRTRRSVKVLLAAALATVVVWSPVAAQAAPATWSPPANLVTPLNQVWQHVEQTYNNGNLYGFRNYGWDQVMANGGYVNYCVRWDSSASVTAAQRDQIQAALARQHQKWMDELVGHNGWPYTNVPVRVVGWAVRNRAQLQWTDNSVDIYVGDIRETLHSAPRRAAASSIRTASIRTAPAASATTTTSRCG